MQIQHCTKADFDEILEYLEEFWGSDRTRALHHPMFLYELGDSAFAIRDGDRVAAYLFGFIIHREGEAPSEPRGAESAAAFRGVQHGRGNESRREARRGSPGGSPSQAAGGARPTGLLHGHFRSLRSK